MSSLPTNLALAAFHALKRHPWRVLAVDRGGDKRKVWRAGALLAAASVLADQLRELPDERIGVVFPPSAGGWIANLAVAMAGKSSVNLNFTASPAVIEQMIEIGQVRIIVTASAMVARLKDFPWKTSDSSARQIWVLKEILSTPAAKKSLRAKLLQTFVCPAKKLEKLWHLPAAAPSAEATLLFSSGSTATPKAIPLTHANLLANLDQIEDIGLLPDGIRLLGSLPLFHSFGLTVTMWYPLTHPIFTVISPNPVDCDAIARAVSAERAQLIAGTASVFRLYLKQISPRQLKTLIAVVAGAEKTPAGQHERWKKHFGSDYLEGYGLTETSPVVSVNVPGHNRIGTVGRLVKGLQARIVDVETREVLTHAEAKGVLEVKGPNVFSGYLGDEALNREVLHDGWFWTGDRGSLSADGYVTIDGRMRRFSKIGGEMVCHGAVEEAIAAAYGWQGLPQLPLAVTGCRDAVKGEGLVVISSRPLELSELRTKLQAQKVPNLWIPRRLITVEAIPFLPTGKLDLQALEKIAQG